MFGHLDSNKKRILKDIKELDYQDVNGELVGSDRLKRMDLVSHLRVTNKNLKSLISQKARANWLKYGDSCTRLYHSTLRWRRLRNEVKGFEVGGQWSEEPEVLRKEAHKLFEDKFVATKDFGVSLGAVEFKSLCLEDNLSLIVDFTEEEIKEKVCQCDGSKSLGPKGYNFNFIKKSWNVMRNDFVAVVAHFQETASILKGCNASFIALVPKVRDTTRLDQYRPISLVGALYKIISNVLSGRIKNVLTSVID